MKTLISYLFQMGLIVFFISSMLSCDQSSVNNEHEKENSIVRKKIPKAVTLTEKSEAEFVFSEKDLLINMLIDSNKLDYYQLDTEKSLLLWYCVTHTGYVKFNENKIGLQDGNIVEANLDICMDSIRNTDIDYYLMRETLVNTLKSVDFFDVKRYPTSSFKLTHISKVDANQYHMAGDLKIQDISHRISFKCTISQNDSTVIMISDKFSIDRTKWGLTIYSENYEQTDDSFLFTDMIAFRISMVFNR
ncbi:MAG: hypothetical protein B7C24_02810 [Bacteroidetes bacterium 4572_77]|nr:MAG: hypothetical protein B7C24_02810 [Bacteroidetes bacterium 4572_77]